MSSNILFPFRSKYRELGLGKRWWHRLALVLFVIALTAELLMGVWATLEAYGERNSQLSIATSDYLAAKMKLDPNVSPKENQALNQHYSELCKSIDNEAEGTLWLDIVLTLGFLAALSYILQLFYRAVIYVAYGNKRESESS
jgi:hypothetical protein